MLKYWEGFVNIDCRMTKIKLKIFPFGGNNQVIECAVESESQYIISGGRKHLLKLKNYENIKIISPAEFYRAHQSL